MSVEFFSLAVLTAFTCRRRVVAPSIVAPPHTAARTARPGDDASRPLREEPRSLRGSGRPMDRAR